MKASKARFHTPTPHFFEKLQIGFVCKVIAEMWKRKLFLSLLIVFLTSSAIPLPDFVVLSDQGLSITSPVQGDVLSGVVDILGTSELKGFARSELAFTYAIGSLETWFPISVSIKSVKEGLLAVWDTTLITDGDYRLRLRVISDDNSINEFVISLVSIRNYTPTISPSQTNTEVAKDPTATRQIVTVAPVPISTGLPENPLMISPEELALSVVYGILGIFGLVVISSIYTRWQRK